jgi:serine protease AprX
MKLTRQIATLLSVIALAGMLLPSAASAAVLGKSLQQKIAQLTEADRAGVVIIAFEGDGPLSAAQLDSLKAAGITGGFTLPALGMVAVPSATVAQVRALAALPGVRSVWGNDPLHLFMHEARILTGVDEIETDTAMTTTNGGLPVSGAGDFSVVINDSGIDATHDDLKLGEHVIQNVQILTDEAVAAVPVVGFTPLVFIENVPNTDTHIGHGTHCAGIVGGSGVRSGGLYRGVAPGAKLIGTGSGAVQFILAGLGGFEWSLANQARYKIRVITNSWGGSGPFDPADPINIASKKANDRNIVVLFAAGNEGPAPDTHNPYAKAPWVISVAAGTKEGGLADFSSRGTPKAQRLADGDPHNDYDAPTLTAPGTGREFETNAGKFTAAIVATRSTPNVVANGLTNDTEIPVPYLPFYTQISGTSMATPHVAGVVALMLDANPTLTPAQVKQILIDTTTVMPGYEEWEVGAGYVNAWAAVDKSFNSAKPYASLAKTDFYVDVTKSQAPTETATIAYSPSATPGPTSSNAVPFTVAAGTDILEVTIEYGNTDLTLFGNILILRVYSPDGTEYTNAGSVLFATDTPRRYIRVLSPTPGQWYAEARGARGIASVPQVTSPVALALPDEVNVFINRTQFQLSKIKDIAGNPYQAEIEHALKFRYMDLYSDYAFKPTRTVTRADFAEALRVNAPLRQAVKGAAFTDVSAELRPLAQAVAAKGSTLRHYNYTDGELITPNGASFKPAANLTRLELAVALIRALGHEDQAKALAGSTVTVKNQAGVALPLSDLGDIPADKRGHVQLALNKVFLAPNFTTLTTAKFNPSGTVTRAELAAALNSFRDAFSLE